MKDSRFIELLNLYVDHQLSPHEARELDAELHANPARRQTYFEYCRMQKACTLLFENERAAAPASPALARAIAEADRKITQHPFNQSRAAARRASHWWRGLFAIGSLSAAAACAAIALFVFKSGDTRPPAPSTDTTPAAIAAAAPAQNESIVQLAAITPTPAPAAQDTIDLKSLVKRFRAPAVTNLAQEPVSLTATQPSLLTDNDPDFAWAKDLQLRPIRKVSIDDAIANLRRLEQQEIDTPILRAPANSPRTATERTAIEFKK